MHLRNAVSAIGSRNQAIEVGRWEGNPLGEARRLGTGPTSSRAFATIRSWVQFHRPLCFPAFRIFAGANRDPQGGRRELCEKQTYDCAVMDAE